MHYPLLLLRYGTGGISLACKAEEASSIPSETL